MGEAGKLTREIMELARPLGLAEETLTRVAYLFARIDDENAQRYGRVRDLPNRDAARLRGYLHRVHQELERYKVPRNRWDAAGRFIARNARGNAVEKSSVLAYRAALLRIEPWEMERSYVHYSYGDADWPF